MKAEDPRPPSSRLYACRVLHERFSPRRHRFAYGMFYLAVDLDELETVDRSLRIFSVNRGNLFSLREADYLPLGEPVHNASTPAEPAPCRGAVPLKDRVAAFCRTHGVELGENPRVLLLTMPRIFGYAFNPVSFYVCSDKAGMPVCAIAEVTNTFGEMKAYLLRLAPDSRSHATFGARVAKHFYVSPFSDLDVAFDFRLHAPGRRFAVRIDDYDGDLRTLHSSLTGRAVPLSDARLAWWLVRYPLLTVRVIALIHWHAFRLWLKRIPYFPKAAGPGLQRDLRRPHSSIAH